MKLITRLLITLSAFGLTLLVHSCTPTVEKLPIPESEFSDDELRLFYITDNQVYRTTMRGTVRFLFYGEDTLTMRRLPRMNYQRTRLAITEGDDRIPVILDKQGRVVERLEQFDHVTEMAWSPDGESLIIICTFNDDYPVEQSFHVWGESYEPPIDFGQFGDLLRCDVLAVGPGGSIAWGETQVRPFSWSTSVMHHTYIRPSISRNTFKAFNYLYGRPGRVSFSPDSAEVLFTLTWESSSSFTDKTVVEIENGAEEIPSPDKIGGAYSVAVARAEPFIMINRSRLIPNTTYAVGSSVGFGSFDQITPSYISHPIEIEYK